MMKNICETENYTVGF